MAAGSDQDQDRSEPATPFKLREARKRGQVAKSLEINSLLLLSVALVVSYFMGDGLIEKQLVLSKELLSAAGAVDLDARSAAGIFEYTTSFLVHLLAPFVAALMLTGIVANMFQTGPIFSFFPLKPDMNRLNPVTGFKRVFSKKLLFEAIKTIIKIGIFGSILYFAISALLPKVVALLDTDPHVYPAVVMAHGRVLAYKLLLAILLIALLDLMYSRWDFSQQMRMSRRDLKEEVKRREGDPQIRAKRRQLQREAVKRAGAVQRVPDADVLITNPTHLSVAIKYERGQSSAPQVIAKGAGDLAMKMRQVARKHRVVMVENKPLARALFNNTAIDDPVPEKLFPTVAKILAWIYLQRDMQAGLVSGTGRTVRRAQL
ncbi:flagellar biosynthesis protein FlhB [Marinobacterium sp. D7]|uniref:flagellar biosynthesis protein FlhB n=1 Tax=Marinobacterium ramblicola TaxID=2849041 RepID=UPI001C2D2C42|nr:flagellar biosynthesis protein FlhB [Marinobacterium ramblicola]MBV1787737.1 flagellar biosynthesis protein FlhB [Marinobacterium ramblicola]